MKRLLTIFAVAIVSTIFNPAKANFGDADFPIGMFDDGPKSYHDAWCRKIKQECRVRFQGQAMWVEGQGGIQRNQLIGFRYKEIWVGGFAGYEHYNYISYKSSEGNIRQALFLFTNDKAQRSFMNAFLRWEKQESEPIPNYKYPNSQGPQETHGKDKGLNPYDNPPIEDWSIETNKKGMKGKINCDSPVWKNRKVCQ